MHNKWMAIRKTARQFIFLIQLSIKAARGRDVRMPEVYAQHDPIVIGNSPIEPYLVFEALVEDNEPSGLPSPRISTNTDSSLGWDDQPQVCLQDEIRGPTVRPYPTAGFDHRDFDLKRSVTAEKDVPLLCRNWHPL